MSGELRALIVGLGANPRQPQEMHRQFGVDRGLCWKVSKLEGAASIRDAIDYLPGTEAFDTFLEALGRAGADEGAIARTQRAKRAVFDAVTHHLDDRPTLDLVLDALPTGDANSLEQSRKLVFRGNSGLYGVQAKGRVVCDILAPTPGAYGKVDIATIGGFVGVRRMRSDVTWPLFGLRFVGGKVEDGWAPLFPAANADEDAVGLVRDPRFSDVDRIVCQRSDEGVDYVLPPGPIGNGPAFNCFRAKKIIGLPGRFKNAENKGEGAFGAHSHFPIAKLMFDWIVHKDLGYPATLRTETLTMSAPWKSGSKRVPQIEVPIRPMLRRVPSNMKALNTPLFPEYTDLLERVFGQMGWNIADFECVRMEMDYPPMGSVVFAKFALPEAPSGGAAPSP